MIVEDADVLGIWDNEGVESIYHAHLEGFWLLGIDATEWIQNVVKKICD